MYTHGIIVLLVITNRGDREIKRLTYSLIVLGIVFASMFWGEPAHAQTRAEYDQIVAEAQAKLSAAQQAFLQAQEANQQAIADGQQIQSRILTAQQDLLDAQEQYETALILDPDWIRPTKEIQIAEQVPHTIQVPHTEIVQETRLVPRIITTVIPGGLTARVYNMAGYNNAPPLPSADRLVHTQTVSNINFDWGGGRILGSQLFEDAIVKFTGYITIPSTGTYTFYAPGDDGIQMLIDNNIIINDWYDKGGGGTMVNTAMTAGQHEITLWYYENGGGANVWLYWITPSGNFEIIPASAFGEQTITETVYDEVITYREVTTYTEEIIYETVWHTETVPDLDAEHPSIQNPELLLILNRKQEYLDELTADQIENSGIIEVTSLDVQTKQQELDVAQSELEAIPPFRELPPTPTPSEEPTKEPEEAQPEPLPTPEQTEPTVQPEQNEPQTSVVAEAEQQLEERALANDTGVLPYTVADAVTEIQAEEVLEALTDPTALAGAISEGIAETAAFVGELLTEPGKAVAEVLKNVSQAGLDMSDDQREKAQEVIVPVVIVSQIASMMVGRIK